MPEALIQSMAKKKSWVNPPLQFQLKETPEMDGVFWLLMLVCRIQNTKKARISRLWHDQDSAININARSALVVADLLLKLPSNEGACHSNHASLNLFLKRNEDIKRQRFQLSTGTYLTWWADINNVSHWIAKWVWKFKHLVRKPILCNTPLNRSNLNNWSQPNHFSSNP